jgi:hypothetical protein
MDLLTMLADLEDNDDLHLARLVILLDAFAKNDGSGVIEGLTKLAKLDFFLRYPVYLEKALQARQKTTRDVRVAEHERRSVESAMVRFRYGPWDHRYRRFINLLVARGLAEVAVDGRTVNVRLTERGREAARTLVGQDAFEDVARRARALHNHMNLAGTTLMRFVYETFPEIGDLRLGEEISHEPDPARPNSGPELPELA